MFWNRPFNAKAPERVLAPAPRIERPEFMWGVAIASHQNEGAAPASDWTHAEERGLLPDRAGCGTRFREVFEQDLDLLAGDLGGNAFRTSIEWARLEPRPGQWDAAEVAYLHQLFNAVKRRGLKLVVTLHHFTSPRWIHEGFPPGWERPRTAEAFARYARFVASEFGGAIDYYLTFNEPSNYIAGGYGAGRIPPFRVGPISVMLATRTLIDAHQRAYEAIHAADPTAMVSFSDYNALIPLPGWKLDYTPARLFAAFGERGPDRRWRYLDFVSMHYYGVVTIPEANRFPLRPYNVGVDADSFLRMLHQYYQAYKLPILVAENGMATNNHAARADGWTMPRYMAAHVSAMQRAAAEGVPLLGYLWWTLTDNYEWGSYDARFGLYRVDCAAGDFTRQPTEGVRTFREIAAANGVTPELLERLEQAGA